MISGGGDSYENAVEIKVTLLRVTFKYAYCGIKSALSDCCN